MSVSKREEIVAAFVADLATAVKATYSWVPVGATRELPQSPEAADKTSPASTPLVWVEEGDEELIEAGNGWERVGLKVHVTGIVIRSSHTSGNMSTAANHLLATVKKFCRQWHRAGVQGARPALSGPRTVSVAGDDARVGVDLIFAFIEKDSEPS